MLVLDIIENSFRNYRVGYAAAEAVVLLAIVLSLTAVQFTLFRERERTMTAALPKHSSGREGPPRPPHAWLIDCAIDGALLVITTLAKAWAGTPARLRLDAVSHQAITAVPRVSLMSRTPVVHHHGWLLRITTRSSPSSSVTGVRGKESLP